LEIFIKKADQIFCNFFALKVKEICGFEICRKKSNTFFVKILTL